MIANSSFEIVAARCRNAVEPADMSSTSMTRLSFWTASIHLLFGKRLAWPPAAGGSFRSYGAGAFDFAALDLPSALSQT